MGRSLRGFKGKDRRKAEARDWRPETGGERPEARVGPKNLASGANLFFVRCRKSFSFLVIVIFLSAKQPGRKKKRTRNEE